MDFLIQTLMNKLKGNNPQMFSFINNAMRNGGNPSAVLSQMLNNSTPEQRNSLIRMAKNYGCPESYLKQIQNFK